MVRHARAVACLLLLVLAASPLGSVGQHAGLAAAAKPVPPDTTPPVANAGPNQTVPQGTLVTFNGSGSTDNVGVVNYTWAVPGVPGPAVNHFALPFGSIEAFDPVRPYVYVANTTEVGFVNLNTGNLDKSFPIAHAAAWPLSMAVSPKGYYLVVGIPTGNRGYYDFGPYQGYLTGFNLSTQTEVGEVSVASDIYDVAATDNGFALVSGGSGQWTPLQVVDLRTGSVIGTTGTIWEESSISLHPNGTRVYSVDGQGIYPANFHRFDFTTSAGVLDSIGESYFASGGGGDLWTGPDRIVASNGIVAVAQDNATGDTAHVAQLAVSNIVAAAFAPNLGLYAAADGANVGFYDHDSNGRIASLTLTSAPTAMAIVGHDLEVIAGGVFLTVAVPETFLYGVAPSHRFPNAGAFVVHLTVYDAAGNSGMDTVTITVLDTTPPVAAAGASQTVLHGTVVTLDGTGSTDNVGIVAYWWTFNDTVPVNLSGAVVQWRFNTTGAYVVTLHVMDAAGNQATATTTITVTRDTIPPSAYAWPGGTIYPGMSWTFNANGSTDNVGIASYTWTFTDNGVPVTLHGQQATYTFTHVGDYAVTLTVADFDGNTANATTTVHVIAVPLVTYAHDSTHFTIGFPSAWAVQPDAQIGTAGTVDLLATGASLRAGQATIFVLSGNESVQETDAYLLSQATYALQQIQANDASATLLDPPRIISTANARAAILGVSLRSGTAYQVWGIVVNATYGREWVIVGSSQMTDNATYRAVFTAVIASFSVTAPPSPPAAGTPAWLSQNGFAVALLGTLLGAGVAAGVAWVVGRLRPKPEVAVVQRPPF